MVVNEPALSPGFILLQPALLQPGHCTGRKALGPWVSKASRSACISSVEMPFRYNQEIAASSLAVFRTYGGTYAERKAIGSSGRLLTLGTCIVNGPIPV